MHVLLIQPPLEDFYTTPIRLYPLGLLYAARIFQQSGCKVHILDSLSPLKKKQIPLPADFSYLQPFMANRSLVFRNFYAFGQSVAEIAQAVEAIGPDMVGIASQFTAYYQSVARLAAAIKAKTDLPIFIGGHHASFFAREIRQRTPQIDYVLKGAAETAVSAFLASLKTRHAFKAKPVEWKKVTPAHELIESCHYVMGRKKYISLIAGRGCPYRCDFCSVHRMFGRRIEYRGVNAVLNEMRFNYTHRGVRIFNFEDDNLSFDTRWFARFLKAVIDDPVLEQIELTAMNGICYPTLDEALLVLMRRAGFKQLNLALVTRDFALKRELRRPAPDCDLEQILAAARRLGFFVTVYVIIGLPGQSYAEIKESIDYLLGLDVLVGPSVFYLPPGSVLYDRIQIPEEILTNWNLYRSSAFAVETPQLDRNALIDLVAYTRKRNLENRPLPA